MKNPVEKSGRYQWQVIFFCFVIAALTGVLYRLGMLFPLSRDLGLQNIRHAHSHLMFFGWAGALPLYICLREIGGPVKGLNIMNKALWGMLLFGLLSFPFFLLYGYHPVPVGGFSMPLSVIFSGLVMICWYWYLGGYLTVRKKIGAKQRNVWFEAALVMLTVSSLGAWGVALAQVLGVTSPLIGKALTHFFLATFTEGWVVLATVAILDEALEISPENYLLPPGVLAVLIMLAAPLTFPYGISETLLTPFMLGTARAGGLILGAALFAVAYSMLKTEMGNRSIFIWPLALLMVKSGMQVLGSVIPTGFWLSDYALRLLYLHVLLLGAFTLTGIGYLHISKNLARKSYSGVAFSILIVLASLLLLTRLWPLAWGGMWVYYAVTGAAVLPVVTVIDEWHKLRTQKSKNAL